MKLAQSQVLPYSFQIIYVLMNAPFQFCRITHEIGTAAIAQVERDQRVLAAEVLEIIEINKPVEDDKRGRTSSQRLEEQSNSVSRGDETIFRCHCCSPRNTTARCGSCRKRASRFCGGDAKKRKAPERASTSIQFCGTEFNSRRSYD